MAFCNLVALGEFSSVVKLYGMQRLVRRFLQSLAQSLRHAAAVRPIVSTISSQLTRDDRRAPAQSHSQWPPV